MSIAKGAELTLENTTISNLKMDGNSDFGHIISNNGGKITLVDSSIIDCVADTRCSTVVSNGNSTLVLRGSTQIKRNTAPRCGGALLLQDNATLIIDSNQVVLAENRADKGSMICMDNNYNISYLNISNIGPSSSGTVYLGTRELAKNFTSTPSYDTLKKLNSANLGSVVFNSKSVGLAFAQSDVGGAATASIKKYSLLPSQQIPRFQVKEVDYFGNSISDLNGVTFIEMGDLSPVIYMTESTGSVNLLGETSKVLPTGADWFDDVSINTTGSNLTSFNLTISAYTGTMDFDNTTTSQWLTITVDIANCDGVTNTNWTDSNGMTKCYNFCPIDRSFKVGFSSIGVIFVLISGVVIFAMKVRVFIGNYLNLSVSHYCLAT